jgi:hypothetical protein
LLLLQSWNFLPVNPAQDHKSSSSSTACTSQFFQFSTLKSQWPRALPSNSGKFSHECNDRPVSGTWLVIFYLEKVGQLGVPIGNMDEFVVQVLDHSLDDQAAQDKS